MAVETRAGLDPSRSTLSIMRILLLSCLIPVVLTLATLTAAEPVFPHIASNVPVDPAVHWGRLDNGLRWAVRPNRQPPGKVTLRLQVQVGSWAERDSEQGLAHLLEHLAFLGTTHYPPGELNNVLQPLGIGFGSHSNAHTGFDETVYKLDLPNSEPETLDLGLRVLADYAGGMLLDPAEIEREIGVVLAEMRDRDTPDLRIHRARFAAAYAGTLLSERFPIGIDATVRAANHQRLRDFYDAWYRPERMVLAVVGDVDPAAVISRIPTHFGSLTARAEARDVPTVDGLNAEPLVALVFRESEAAVTRVGFSVARREAATLDTLATRQAELLISAAHACLRRRMEAFVAAHPTGPVVDVRCGSWWWLGMREALVDVSVRDGRQDEALALLAQEWQRFHRYGPTAAELHLIQADYRGQLAAAVAQADRRESPALASQLYTSITEHQVFSTPQDEQQFLAPMIDALDIERLHAAFIATWEPGRRLIAVTGPAPTGDAESVIAQWRTAIAKPVDPPTTVEDVPFAYGERPVAGAITDRQVLRHDIEQMTLDNGVVAAIQPSARKPGEVRIRWRFAVPPGLRDPAVGEWASRAFLAGGLAAHPQDQLQRLLAGRSVNVSFHVADDAVILDATTIPDDVEIAFQVLRAYTVAPGWHTDGLIRALDRWRQELAVLPSQLDAQVWRRFSTLATAAMPGRRPATSEEALASTGESLRAWLEPILATAPVTVSVVGDVEAGTARDLIATYAGSLPARVPEPTLAGPQDLARHAVTPIPRERVTMTVAGPVPRATILLAWPTEGMRDIAAQRRLRLLADAVGERVREHLRATLGQAYSPRAWHDASDVWDGFGYLAVMASVAPDQAAITEAAIREVVAEIAADGVDAELLAQVQPPLLNALDGVLAANTYWLNSVVDRLPQQKFRLDWADSMREDIAAITAEELSALAFIYLASEPLTVVGVSPPSVADPAVGDQGQSEPAR